MKKRSFCKRLLVFICLLALMLSITACGLSSKVRLFDRTVEMIEKRNADKDSVESHDIYEKLKKMGLTELDEECALDREFVKKYLETCSVEEFFRKIQIINAFMMDYGVWTSECKTVDATLATCTRQKCNTLLRLVLEEGGVEVANLKLPAEGTDGYYSEHADMYPTYFEKMVERGYNYGPYNEIGYDYQPHYLEITYYGDFALFHSYGYTVNPGKYGWYNGVFKDEPSSWEYEDIYYIGYRGAYITDDYTSAEAAIAAAESLETFTIGNVTYRFTEQMPCGDSGHTYQDWRVFFDAEVVAQEEQEAAAKRAEEQTQLNNRYNEALALMEAGKYSEAITTFESLGEYNDSAEKILHCNYSMAVDLEESGAYTQAMLAYKALGDYLDAQARLSSLWDHVAVRETICAGAYHTAALTENGTVLSAGSNKYGQCGVEAWKDIIAITAGTYHTVGLTKSGTVMVAGGYTSASSTTRAWKNIVAIAAGDTHTVGLKADGTVVAVGWNEYGQCEVDSWNDIVAVSAGYRHTVGLKADGTVVATTCNDSYYSGQCDVAGWKDIIAIAAGGVHTVGLKADGTVVAVGQNEDGQCNVEQWTNIIAIAAYGDYTVGLKADGTVVVTGETNNGQTEAQSWENIVVIAAGGGHILGLKADGTPVATTYKKYSTYDEPDLGQSQVGDWKDIKHSTTNSH